MGDIEGVEVARREEAAGENVIGELHGGEDDQDGNEVAAANAEEPGQVRARPRAGAMNAKEKRGEDEKKKAECQEKLKHGTYEAINNPSARCNSGVWDYIQLVVDRSGKATGFVQCKYCKVLKLHQPRGSTTGLKLHASCKDNVVEDERRTPTIPLTPDVKSKFCDTLADWCAGELIAPEVVEGKYFSDVIQHANHIGDDHGKIDVSKVVPCANTVRSKISKSR